MASKDPNRTNQRRTRSGRNAAEKKTPNWTIALILILLAVALYLVFQIFSSGNNEEPNGIQFPYDTSAEQFDDTTATDVEENEETNTDTSDQNGLEENEPDEENVEEDTSSDPENEETDDPDLEPAEPSDDLVINAYTADWPPVSTSQDGPHTSTDFSEGSLDRIEIKQAVSMATGLSEDEMIEWWIGNNGQNRVVATVSDTAETEIYRVFLEWVDNEGWRPEKVEELRENDRKNN